MSGYRRQLQREINQLNIEINQTVADLAKADNNSFHSTVSKLNDLRSRVAAKKDRLFYLDKPRPMMPDIQPQLLINF